MSTIVNSTDLFSAGSLKVPLNDIYNARLVGIILQIALGLLPVCLIASVLQLALSLSRTSDVTVNVFNVVSSIAMMCMISLGCLARPFMLGQFGVLLVAPVFGHACPELSVAVFIGLAECMFIVGDSLLTILLLRHFVVSRTFDLQRSKVLQFVVFGFLGASHIGFFVLTTVSSWQLLQIKHEALRHLQSLVTDLDSLLAVHEGVFCLDTSHWATFVLVPGVFLTYYFSRISVVLWMLGRNRRFIRNGSLLWSAHMTDVFGVMELQTVIMAANSTVTAFPLVVFMFLHFVAPSVNHNGLLFIYGLCFLSLFPLINLGILVVVIKPYRKIAANSFVFCCGGRGWWRASPAITFVEAPNIAKLPANVNSHFWKLSDR